MMMEKRLQTRLVNRTTRQISLTEPGRRYLRHCEQILNLVDRADAEAANARVQPSGKLRVHATTGIGQHYLTPAVVQYTQNYPDVEVEMVLAQRSPDLIEEDFDVSIVAASGLKDSSLVSQRIGIIRGIICAAPRYLSKHGKPTSFSDLACHTCVQLIAQDGSCIPWIFGGLETLVFHPHRIAPIKVNVAEALTEAVKAGAGVGVLSASAALQGIRDGSLIQLLPDVLLQAQNLYALYASREHLDAKIRSFVRLLQETIPKKLLAEEQELRSADYRRIESCAGVRTA